MCQVPHPHINISNVLLLITSFAIISVKSLYNIWSHLHVDKLNYGYLIITSTHYVIHFVDFQPLPTEILAVARINEALDNGDPAETLEALQTPGAKLDGVEAGQAVVYQTILQTEKEQKAKV